MSEILHFKCASPESVCRLCMLCLAESKTDELADAFIKSKKPQYIRWCDGNPKVTVFSKDIAIAAVSACIYSKLNGDILACNAYVLNLMNEEYEASHFEGKTITPEVVWKLCLRMVNEQTDEEIAKQAYEQLDYAVLDKIDNVCIESAFGYHEECVTNTLAYLIGNAWKDMSDHAKESYVRANLLIKNCSSDDRLINDICSDLFTSSAVYWQAEGKPYQYSKLAECISQIISSRNAGEKE